MNLFATALLFLQGQIKCALLSTVDETPATTGGDPEEKAKEESKVSSGDENVTFCSGRFKRYFEENVMGEGPWVVGVESLADEEPEDRDGLWAIGFYDGDEGVPACCFVSDIPVSQLSLRQRPHKVGVFMDYQYGLVSFYDVDNMSHIYTFTGQNFREKLVKHVRKEESDEEGYDTNAFIDRIKDQLLDESVEDDIDQEHISDLIGHFQTAFRRKSFKFTRRNTFS